MANNHFIQILRNVLLLWKQYTFVLEAFHRVPNYNEEYDLLSRKIDLYFFERRNVIFIISSDQNATFWMVFDINFLTVGNTTFIWAPYIAANAKTTKLWRLRKDLESGPYTRESLWSDSHIHKTLFATFLLF